MKSHCAKLDKCVENGSKGLHKVISEIAGDFMAVKVDKSERRPVVAVIGEIFMRANAGCNGDVANKLEDLGLELVIGPFSEWIKLLNLQVHTRQQMEKRYKRCHKIKNSGIRTGYILPAHC